MKSTSADEIQCHSNFIVMMQRCLVLTIFVMPLKFSL
nr:MAG TPA: hypothetical protein [Caudoviricetes sp.]